MARLGLVSITTADGLELSACLWEPERPNRLLPVDAVILNHGSMGTFHQPLMCYLGEILSAEGLTCLSISNRGHDVAWQDLKTGRYFGHAYEDVDESRLDLRAALDWLAGFNVQRVCLVGHSLGAVKVTYFGAKESHPLLHAIAAVSPPRLSVGFFLQSDGAAKMKALRREAKQRLDAGEGESLFEPDFPFHKTLLSTRTYYDKYCTERFNIVTFVDQLQVPYLYVVGSLEQGVTHLRLADDLKRAPQGPASRTIQAVPGADHFYMGVQHLLGSTIVGWLKGL